jgi:hypothetical protein
LETFLDGWVAITNAGIVDQHVKLPVLLGYTVCGLLYESFVCGI